MCKPECNCGSTYEEEDGSVIHFEDCAVIEKMGLVVW